MENIFETYKPQGFYTVTAYLFVNDAPKLIEFLRAAFYAKEINRSVNPENGDIANCILQIGDSCFMISQARNQFNWNASRSLFICKRCRYYGATLEFEPTDMPYGDRQSGIIDPCGNYWWISKRTLLKGYHE